MYCEVEEESMDIVFQRLMSALDRCDDLPHNPNDKDIA
jgi:hypothetical protein